MGFLGQIRNDIIFLQGVLRALRMTTPIAKNPTRVFPRLFDGLAQQYGDAPALIGERESFTYRSLAARCNRYARWALAQGIRKGDTVCLLMPNRPEYMAIWLGITQAGGVVSLLNTNLVGPSLAYCIDIAAPKHVIVAGELAALLEATLPLLKSAPTIWLHGGNLDYPRIDTQIETFSAEPLPAQVPLTINDRALYIYTSGTTGRPKAANVNHYRLMLASYGFAGVMDTRATDRMYNCLPMYHTVGGVVATGALLVNGGATVIRERFSARDFWDDVARSECTLFQYIGELCRYLLHTPASPAESRHKLRLACGNGLRPDMWDEFKQRFHIPRIIEFYAATEGNVTLINFEGKPGAVGRVPWYMAHRFPVTIVRFDVEKEQPVRDAAGFCIRCAPDEVGEAIGKIVNDSSQPTSRFEGYASAAEDEKKILRNVFEPGDSWFRTGDLMRKDKDGYFYFADRIGDTFRWKGENVSTTEVAETINTFPGVLQSNVYGVQVSGKDGRAGMAALVCSGALDLPGLRAFLGDHLPDYARPVFLRISGELEVTATFKQKKMDLVRQGFDPAQTTDAIYFNDPRAKAFVRLDKPLYDRIQSGEVRL